MCTTIFPHPMAICLLQINLFAYLQDPIPMATALYACSLSELMSIYDNAPAETVLKYAATMALQLHLDTNFFAKTVSCGFFEQGISILLKLAEANLLLGARLCPILFQLMEHSSQLQLSTAVQDNMLNMVTEIYHHWGFVIEKVVDGKPIVKSIDDELPF